MKKIIIILVLTMLTGCGTVKNVLVDDKFEKMGYSKKTIELINQYSLGDYITSYDETVEKIIDDPSFEAEYIEDYLKLAYLGSDDCLMVVNKRYFIDDESYSEDLLELMKTDYYLHSRHERYLNLVKDGYGYRDAVEMVNANADYDPYDYIVDADISDDILMIANKYYTLNEYVPDDLVSIDSAYGIDSYLREEVYKAYVKMADEASNDGLSLWITSAYRSYSKQYSLYNSYLENDPQYVVDTYSSRPGFSDHQTGLTVDIIAPGYDLGTFEYSDECKWLKDNAYRFGFIMRYPEGKEDITGYTYESWHYRYVGENAALYIHNNGITFDEYYAYFVSGEY